MITKPKAVVVRLPLSADQEETLFEISERDCLNSAIAAIGTPVAGDDIPIITVLGTVRDPVPCVLQSDAQAAKAALADAQAENVQLREALEGAKTFHEEQDKAISKQPPSAQGQWRRHQHQEQIENIEEALKGGNL